MMTSTLVIAQTGASSGATGQPVQPAGMPGAAPIQATPGSTGTATTGAPGTQAAPGILSMGGMLIPLVAVMGVMVLMTFWTQRKDKKKREEMMSGIKRGDKVMTSAGMIGIITDMNDTEVVLRMEEGRIRFSRSAIQGVLREGPKESSKDGTKMAQAIEAKDANKPVHA